MPQLRPKVRAASRRARLLLGPCRHQAGRVPPDEQAPAPDPEVVARLFDPRRDPEEQVRDDDWFPGSPEMQELYAWDTVGKRRRWFRELQREGRLAR